MTAARMVIAGSLSIGLVQIAAVLAAGWLPIPGAIVVMALALVAGTFAAVAVEKDAAASALCGVVAGGALIGFTVGLHRVETGTLLTDATVADIALHPEVQRFVFANPPRVRTDACGEYREHIVRSQKRDQDYYYSAAPLADPSDPDSIRVFVVERERCIPSEWDGPVIAAVRETDPHVFASAVSSSISEHGLAVQADPILVVAHGDLESEAVWYRIARGVVIVVTLGVWLVYCGVGALRARG